MITGSCFCGDIGYEYQGELRDARSCHCSQCRKAFSSQASAYALVDASQFRWVRGEQQLVAYDSQASFGLRFCGRCGSTLCGTYNDSVHGVTLGCVEGDPEVEIGMHIFLGSKASWEKLPDDIVGYQEGPP